MKPDQFESLQGRIERGDPVAIYEAIELCTRAGIEMPTWLADHLLSLIADFHLGKKASWKKVGMRPLSIIRRRIEDDVKRRAIDAARAWKADKNAYHALPRRCIKALYRGCIKHENFQTMEDCLRLVQFGLRGLRIEKNGPLLKCSPRTLRRADEAKNIKSYTPISSSVARVFGLNDPDSFFGLDEPPPNNFRP